MTQCRLGALRRDTHPVGLSFATPLAPTILVESLVLRQVQTHRHKTYMSNVCRNARLASKLPMSALKKARLTCAVS